MRFTISDCGIPTSNPIAETICELGFEVVSFLPGL
jgi:hypothetical protein